MTIEQLRERLAYWQRVLRLQDWDVALDFAAPKDFSDRTNLGDNSRQPQYRRALIRLLDPALDEGAEPFHTHFPYDPEQILLHELLHCIVPSDSDDADEAEYAVDTLASAFLRLERRRAPGPSVDSTTLDIERNA